MNQYVLHFTYGFLFALCTAMLSSGVQGSPLDRYNVVWDTPGSDHHDSMPIGNGDIGLNVWTEPGGDLVILIAKSDAWSGNARLLKLGRVRLSFSPHDPMSDDSFTQTLRLRQGEIEISHAAGENNQRIRVWVDAHRPAIHIQSESTTA